MVSLQDNIRQLRERITRDPPPAVTARDLDALSALLQSLQPITQASPPVAPTRHTRTVTRGVAAAPRTRSPSAANVHLAPRHDPSTGDDRGDIFSWQSRVYAPSDASRDGMKGILYGDGRWHPTAFPRPPLRGTQGGETRLPLSSVTAYDEAAAVRRAGTRPVSWAIDGSRHAAPPPAALGAQMNPRFFTAPTIQHEEQVQQEPSGGERTQQRAAAREEAQRQRIDDARVESRVVPQRMPAGDDHHVEVTAVAGDVEGSSGRDVGGEQQYTVLSRSPLAAAPPPVAAAPTINTATPVQHMHVNVAHEVAPPPQRAPLQVQPVVVRPHGEWVPVQSHATAAADAHVPLLVAAARWPTELRAKSARAPTPAAARGPRKVRTYMHQLSHAVSQEMAYVPGQVAAAPVQPPHARSYPLPWRNRVIKSRIGDAVRASRRATAPLRAAAAASPSAPAAVMEAPALAQARQHDQSHASMRAIMRTSIGWTIPVAAIQPAVQPVQQQDRGAMHLPLPHERTDSWYSRAAREMDPAPVDLPMRDVRVCVHGQRRIIPRADTDALADADPPTGLPEPAPLLTSTGPAARPAVAARAAVDALASACAAALVQQPVQPQQRDVPKSARSQAHMVLSAIDAVQTADQAVGNAPGVSLGDAVRSSTPAAQPMASNAQADKPAAKMRGEPIVHLTAPAAHMERADAVPAAQQQRDADEDDDNMALIAAVDAVPVADMNIITPATLMTHLPMVRRDDTALSPAIHVAPAAPPQAPLQMERKPERHMLPRARARARAEML